MGFTISEEEVYVLATTNQLPMNMIEAYVKNGGDKNSLMNVCATSNNVRCVRKLLKLGADPNSRFFRDEDGSLISFVDYVVDEDFPESFEYMIETLIQHGAMPSREGELRDYMKDEYKLDDDRLDEILAPLSHPHKSVSIATAIADERYLEV